MMKDYRVAQGNAILTDSPRAISRFPQADVHIDHANEGRRNEHTWNVTNHVESKKHTQPHNYRLLFLMLLLDFFSPPLPSPPAPASSAFRLVPAPAPVAVLTDTSVDFPVGPPAASFATCASAALQSAAPSAIAYLRHPQRSAIYVRGRCPSYIDAGERSSEAAPNYGRCCPALGKRAGSRRPSPPSQPRMRGPAREESDPAGEDVPRAHPHLAQPKGAVRRCDGLATFTRDEAIAAANASKPRSHRALIWASNGGCSAAYVLRVRCQM
ncbi:hypothetical protein C8Q79DRAFT_532944 [Trametes meyenii]|nr:hypothetical protein C8Q79DRAFT_532944 [Trametes meyenii]